MYFLPNAKFVIFKFKLLLSNLVWASSLSKVNSFLFLECKQRGNSETRVHVKKCYEQWSMKEAPDSALTVWKFCWKRKYLSSKQRRCTSLSIEIRSWECSRDSNAIKMQNRHVNRYQWKRIPKKNKTNTTWNKYIWHAILKKFHRTICILTQ